MEMQTLSQIEVRGKLVQFTAFKTLETNQIYVLQLWDFDKY